MDAVTKYALSGGVPKQGKGNNRKGMYERRDHYTPLRTEAHHG